jgi:hypothetical protein|tara:strand:- start:1974 stop:2231 length:258 start_codon:yes stop_codon:yes gene_type:complete
MKHFYQLLVSNILFFLILAVLTVMLVGCSKTIKATDNELKSSPPNFQAIADVLGCMFAPGSCSNEANDDQEEITKELDELDKEQE